MVGIRSPDGLVVGSYTSHPGVLGSFPKREEPGKTGAPCVKVPGSSRVPVRDEQTHPHSPRLVVSHSTCPPLSSSPHAHSFVIGPAVIKHTHFWAVGASLFRTAQAGWGGRLRKVDTAVINTYIPVCACPGHVVLPCLVLRQAASSRAESYA